MKCTNCNRETNNVRTEHYHNFNGKLINLMPKGARWCPQCVKKKLGNVTLKDYAKKMKRSYYE